MVTFGLTKLGENTQSYFSQFGKKISTLVPQTLKYQIPQLVCKCSFLSPFLHLFLVVAEDLQQPYPHINTVKPLSATASPLKTSTNYLQQFQATSEMRWRMYRIFTGYGSFPRRKLMSDMTEVTRGEVFTKIKSNAKKGTK